MTFITKNWQMMVILSFSWLNKLLFDHLIYHVGLYCIMLYSLASWVTHWITHEAKLVVNSVTKITKICLICNWCYFWKKKWYLILFDKKVDCPYLEETLFIRQLFYKIGQQDTKNVISTSIKNIDTPSENPEMPP